ncbi:MAG: hypothetical protein JWP89_3370 [Schlesneria sp.]|nr:hypothetical protein [Schlesneria sp.]
MSSQDSHPNDLQPRAQRKRKRSSAERGLASDSDLADLASVYLETQHRLWPELVKKGIVPAKSEGVIRQMVEQYKECHQGHQLDASAVANQYRDLLIKLAAAYARYSCDNSSPTSIVDQVVNALEKAHEHGRFIPWEFIFTDYSVSGLDSGRLGYLNCKSLINDPGKSIDTVYIDDFSRASRDSLEWWRLGWFCKRVGMRMFGASDGFDLFSPNWDIFITIYGLLSRLFIRNTQEKVARGMKGAARRKTCLGRPPLGLTRKAVRGAQGEPVVRGNGKPLFTWEIDPISRQIVELLFHLFVDLRLSAYQISKQFNQQKIDGTDTWSESTVKKMLWNPAYIGVFIWNRTRREYDYEKEKFVKVRNARSEWIVNYAPEKAIIPMEKWRAARRLLAQSKRKPGSPKPVSRNQARSTTLFSATLFCAYCGRELTLYRSAGKYKNMFCQNGRGSVHGCELCTSKSTRVIEDCLLGFLRVAVLTETAIDELVVRANEHLKTLAATPKIDAAPNRSKIASLQKKIDFLHQRIEILTASETELCEGYERRIKQHQKEMNELRKQVKAADQANMAVPTKLSKKSLRSYLPELRAILDQEIPVAAEAIRKLTGPISIRQEPIPGKTHGARWIATFSPDLLAFLRHVTRGKDYPDSITLEFLCHGIWTIPKNEVETIIEQIPRYEELAQKFRELRNKGASVQSIAAAHGLCWDQAKMVLHFAETGERPKWPKKQKKIATTRQQVNREKYKSICAEVKHRRAKQETFTKIAQELNACESTVRRAWDHVHLNQVKDAVAIGATPDRGKSPKIPEAKICELHDLLKGDKLSVREMVSRTGLSQSTVRREKQRIKDR